MQGFNSRMPSLPLAPDAWSGVNQESRSAALCCWSSSSSSSSSLLFAASCFGFCSRTFSGDAEADLAAGTGVVVAAGPVSEAGVALAVLVAAVQAVVERAAVGSGRGCHDSYRDR